MFPLCGASLDLGWLHSRGHTVVGVEGVRKAVEKLFRWEVVFAHSYGGIMFTASLSAVFRSQKGTKLLHTSGACPGDGSYYY